MLDIDRKPGRSRLAAKPLQKTKINQLLLITKDHERLRTHRKSVSMSQLEEWFEKFNIIECGEFDSEEVLLDGKEEQSSSNVETSPSLIVRSLPDLQDQLDNSTHAKVQIPNLGKELLAYSLLKKYQHKLLWDEKVSLQKQNDKDIDALLVLENLLISSRTNYKPNTAFVIKKSLTINDYNRLSVNLKFKICLNFIRHNIFKKIEYIRTAPKITTSLSDGLDDNDSGSGATQPLDYYQETLNVHDLSNIKNVFFYQIFKRFEEYYRLNNKFINCMNIPQKNKVKVIEVVEKVYLNNWNLNGCTKLEQDLLRDIY